MNDTIIGPRPDFLDRTPGDVRPVRRQRKGWKATPLMKLAKKHAKEIRATEDARASVHAAVRDGADTLGKVRKATGLDNQAIRATLRFYIGCDVIRRVGKRYFVEG